jgi:epoxyqueuosine reductase
MDVYQAWLEAGYHADMGWMSTERALRRRADPREILPACESILVLGVPYPAPREPNRPGRVSSYAWNQDYHDVIPEKLKKLVKMLEERMGHKVPHRWYTDTGPLLERELAQRAGLGWIGRNTCLIHPQKGSYFFLAEILLGIPLEPDRPLVHDYCGSCTRCIEACPTGCILPNRTINANRCLSYLTIELRSAIPPDLRSSMGDWVFGCDVCQLVCPWNQRFAENNTPWEAFRFRSEVADPALEREIALAEEEFRRKFKGSPVKRTKRRGYLRNVAVAIGNEEMEKAVSGLEQALKDAEPLIRGHAAWALGEIGGQKAGRALKNALQTEAAREVRVEIEQALERFDSGG